MTFLKLLFLIVTLSSCAYLKPIDREKGIAEYLANHPEHKRFEKPMRERDAVIGMPVEALLISHGHPRKTKVDLSWFGLKKTYEFNGGKVVYVREGRVVSRGDY